MAIDEGAVRRATTEDLNAVLELDRDAPVGHERSALLTARVESDEVIVFEKGGRLLGYGVVRRNAFFGRDFVELIAVTQKHRRRGVGGSILREAVQTSTTNQLFTSTNESNLPMIRLLQKAGWNFSGRLTGIDEGDPEVVYYMNLGTAL